MGREEEGGEEERAGGGGGGLRGQEGRGGGGRSSRGHDVKKNCDLKIPVTFPLVIFLYELVNFSLCTDFSRDDGDTRYFR